MTTITENTYATLDQAAKAIAADMTEALREALAQQDTVTLALSGGNTPRHVLPILAQAELDWSRVVVTLTDERWVAIDHEDSTEGMVRALFLTGPAAASTFVGLFDPEAPTPPVNAKTAGDRLRGPDVPFPLDVVFLGMGADGHIASLFPSNHPSTKAGGMCVAAQADNHPHWRLSMSVPTIANAKRYFMVVNGDAKKMAYAKAMGGDDVRDMPVRLALKHESAAVAVYFSDE